MLVSAPVNTSHPFANFVVLAVKIKNTNLSENYLYRSNLTFSGVLRGTQGVHFERYVNLLNMNASLTNIPSELETYHPNRLPKKIISISYHGH